MPDSVSTAVTFEKEAEHRCSISCRAGQEDATPNFNPGMVPDTMMRLLDLVQGPLRVWRGQILLKM